MFLSVDQHNGLAIYDQIVRQVKFAVACGALRTGELIPSVREAARELAVNPNTVARAYRELQSEGVLSPVRGTGMQVAEGAERRCRAERVELLRARLKQTLAEAIQSRIEADELRLLVERELAAALKQIEKRCEKQGV
ncbi:MAG TPA: GntR family transcriptional regulator [Pirellulales bacterium]|nr:GntR family transcriptional regulator [Pirellulales bacterium]